MFLNKSLFSSKKVEKEEGRTSKLCNTIKVHGASYCF